MTLDAHSSAWDSSLTATFHVFAYKSRSNFQRLMLDASNEGGSGVLPLMQKSHKILIFTTQASVGCLWTTSKQMYNISAWALDTKYGDKQKTPWNIPH